MEQDTGVEPASAAWEAAVLPMYESCIDYYAILSFLGEKSNRFLTEFEGCGRHGRKTSLR